MRRTTRYGQRALELLSALAIAAATFAPIAHAGPRAPEPEAPLHRGAELVAVADVVLDSVHIAKGSRVTVAGVDYRDGKPASVSLELKDGHVLRAVPYSRVMREFRAGDTTAST